MASKLEKEIALKCPYGLLEILSARLQELVEFGLLSRKAYNEVPLRVEYEPTGKGKGPPRDVRGAPRVAGKVRETPGGARVTFSRESVFPGVNSAR